jgi:predicted SnoaL-like aldol condensation-catalyzing enzyme
MNRIALLFGLGLVGTAAFAALPVTPAKDQAALLKSSDPKLAANKKIAYDFFRIVLRGRRLNEAEKYMHNDYMQHNPNAETGIVGFKAFFSAQGGELPVPETLPGLVAVQAEGDYVTLSFVREYKNSKGEAYTTTWFDMFRIADGRLAEHWDESVKAVPAAAEAAAP